jgi:putative membrane protein
MIIRATIAGSLVRPALLLMSLSTGVALAQSMGNPAGMAPDTPGLEAARPAPDYANNQDRLFVRQAALGGEAEVDFGKLAQKKASSDAVRKFAARMVSEHDKSNERLLRSGRAFNAEIPKDGQKIALDPEHKTIRAEIDHASGADFDIAYMASQVQDHQRTANLLLWEISYGQNRDLTKYASDTLPVVLDHLDMAKRHFAELNSTPPPR